MKLSIGKLYDIYVALVAIDRNDKVRLPLAVRLKLAANLGALQPIAAAYEIARQRRLADLTASGKSQTVVQAEFLAEDAKARGDEEDVTLKMFTPEEIGLSENESITAGVILGLRPVLDGLEF